MNIEVVRFALIFNFFCISCRLSDTKQRERKREAQNCGPGWALVKFGQGGFCFGSETGIVWLAIFW